MNIPKTSKKITKKYSVLNNTFRLDKIKNAELDKYDGKPKDELNTIVGDDKQPDFIPQMKLQRWSNETNFSIRLKDDEKGKEKVETIGDKIKWSKGNKEIEFYDYKDGYKLVWFLKKKPKTNKVEFTIQSKGLNFYRQLPLTEEFKNGYSKEFKKEIVVTETIVKDLKGNVLVNRPPEVVNSYAVYHKTKGGAVDKDGKDYKTGKAFHIYRPHLIDAKGNEAWGILKIEKSIYSVEIPQEFLDKAVYPIKSNDTFGVETVGGSTVTFAGNTIRGIYPYSPTQSGTLSGFVVRIPSLTSSTDTGKIRAVLYKNSDNSLIAYGDEYVYTDGVDENTWKDIGISAESVVGSTEYMISVWCGQGANWHPVFRYDTISNITARDAHTYHATNAPPSTCGWDAGKPWGNYKISVYATYTTGGGSTFTPKAIWF